MSEIVVLKAMSIVGFWVIVLVICPFPLYSNFFNPPAASCAISLRTKRARERLAERLCSLSNSMSGGLFLALGLIHLLPEAAETFVEIYGEETVDKYRPAFAVAFCSYTLLLIIQRVIFSEHGHSHGGGGGDDEHHHHHDNEDDAKQDIEGPLMPANATEEKSMKAYGVGYGGVGDAAAMHHHHEQHDASEAADVGSRRASSHHRESQRRSGSQAHYHHNRPSLLRASTRRSDMLVRIVLDTTGAEESAGAGNDSALRQATEDILYQESSGGAMAKGAGGGGGGDNEAFGDDVPPTTSHASTTKLLTSIVLVLAFSLHGIAEGMALGVQSEADSVYLMILAIALHKWAEALSIGISFLKSGLPRRECLVYIISFSCSSPLGIALGWASEAILPDTVTAYLLAFSTGTFIYLGASDAIVEEFAHGQRKWTKLLFYLFGATIIYLISAFLDHDHGGDDASSSSSSSSGSSIGA